MYAKYNVNSSMRSIRNLKATTLVVIIVGVIASTSIFFFRSARSVIGDSFSGFLTFENGMVGAFSGFDWPGYQEGLRYHDLVISGDGRSEYIVLSDGLDRTLKIKARIFSLKDFLSVFFAPFASGMFYVVCSGIIFIVGRRMRGIVPFVLFNLGIGYYFIASFDFHHGYHASWIFLLNFALLPAYMSHFALVFPEESSWVRKHRWLLAVPYLISLLVYVPYVYMFYREPLTWIRCEQVVVMYAVFSYLFWIAMLSRNARSAARQTDRTAASYLLLGQLIAFVIPLTAAVAIFIFGRNIPLNVIAPVTVAFPVASLFGLVLGNLRNAQLQLVQSEKMASLGSLVAGVAHEINNPTTFIYSNIEMLRDYVSYIKGAVDPGAKKFRGELSASEVMVDLEKLVDTVEEGAERIKAIVTDLRRFGHTQDDVMTKVDFRAGIESTLNLLKHEIKDRISVHLDVAEGLSIEANNGQLNQVWMNLLANAAHAIEGEGNIWIKGFAEGDRIVIEIRDDGKGMSRDVLDRVFDPFFTTKPEGQGIGMGLAICQQIVHRWHGDIVVNSELNKGTTVRVTL